MRLLDAELNNVKRLYDEQMAVFVETGKMPIHKNMAPVSGSLKWSQELRERITIPMNEFRRLEHPYVTEAILLFVSLCHFLNCSFILSLFLPVWLIMIITVTVTYDST